MPASLGQPVPKAEGLVLGNVASRWLHSVANGRRKQRASASGNAGVLDRTRSGTLTVKTVPSGMGDRAKVYSGDQGYSGGHSQPSSRVSAGSKRQETLAMHEPPPPPGQGCYSQNHRGQQGRVWQGPQGPVALHIPRTPAALAASLHIALLIQSWRKSPGTESSPALGTPNTAGHRAAQPLRRNPQGSKRKVH